MHLTKRIKSTRPKRVHESHPQMQAIVRSTRILTLGDFLSMCVRKELFQSRKQKLRGKEEKHGKMPRTSKTICTSAKDIFTTKQIKSNGAPKRHKYTHLEFCDVLCVCVVCLQFVWINHSSSFTNVVKVTCGSRGKVKKATTAANRCSTASSLA